MISSNIKDLQVTALKIKIRQHINFISDEEIDSFCSNHPWLLNENDFVIIEDYLIKHFEGLYMRNKLICDNLIKKKNETVRLFPFFFLVLIPIDEKERTGIS